MRLFDGISGCSPSDECLTSAYRPCSIMRLIGRGHSGPSFCMHPANVGIRCQIIPYVFVRIRYPERSSAKSPCRRVNESCSPLQPLIIAGKIPNGTPTPPPAPQLFRLRASVNLRSQNIFNGFLRVPVNEKIPALNSILITRLRQPERRFRTKQEQTDLQRGFSWRATKFNFRKA